MQAAIRFRKVCARAVIVLALTMLVSSVGALGRDANEQTQREAVKRSQEQKQKTRGEPEKSRLREYSQMAMERLQSITKNGKEVLARVAKDPESDLDRNMRDLQDVVCAAAERARRLSTWDVNAVEAQAEKTFDETIAAITDYLNLVKDDGPVHQASKRIRTAALDKERIFREKAGSKPSPAVKERYDALSKAMRVQAERVTAAWETIRTQRDAVQKTLAELREHRELYVDVKVALGIGEAVKDLEGVATDLGKLSAGMKRVQEAILGEASNAAIKLSQPQKPATKAN